MLPRGRRGRCAVGRCIGPNNSWEAYTGNQAGRKRESHPAQAIQRRDIINKQTRRGFDTSHLKPKEPPQGEVPEGLPASQSVASQERVCGNLGDPAVSGSSNYESQPGSSAQRQEEPTRSAEGVRSVRSNSGQPRAGGADSKEGADTLSQLTKETSAVRMTEQAGQPPCGHRK